MQIWICFMVECLLRKLEEFPNYQWIPCSWCRLHTLVNHRPAFFLKKARGLLKTPQIVGKCGRQDQVWVFLVWFKVFQAPPFGCFTIFFTALNFGLHLAALIWIANRRVLKLMPHWPSMWPSPFSFTSSLHGSQMFVGSQSIVLYVVLCLTHSMWLCLC